MLTNSDRYGLLMMWCRCAAHCQCAALNAKCRSKYPQLNGAWDGASDVCYISWCVSVAYVLLVRNEQLFCRCASRLQTMCTHWVLLYATEPSMCLCCCMLQYLHPQRFYEMAWLVHKGPIKVDNTMSMQWNPLMRVLYATNWWELMYATTHVFFHEKNVCVCVVTCHSTLGFRVQGVCACGV